jgi:hypothetical protein
MAVKGKATAASKPQKPAPVVEDDELDDLLDDSDLPEEEEVEEEEAPAPKAKAKAKAKPAPEPEPEEEEEEEELDLDLPEEEEVVEEEEEAPAPKAKGKKKAAPAPEPEEEEEVVEEEEEAPAPKAKAKAKAKPAASEEEGEKKIEGLTKATQESGVITFNEGSGSQGILILVTKLGFDREKVLKVATSADPKFKKFNEKYFSACDVTKKYGKVIGIIKKLQDAGYKLPSAK